MIPAARVTRATRTSTIGIVVVAKGPVEKGPSHYGTKYRADNDDTRSLQRTCQLYARADDRENANSDQQRGRPRRDPQM